ncbi:MAG: NAD(P)-dependent alcohol dehydrogenase [Bacteroidia bacterium]|nr:NAD(P)-dependent alcohol dehydrogenase [Bacteroidia bacterium]
MKAIVYTQYGPPEVAQLKEMPIPQPKDNEVLVKVHASTVNRTDSGFRSAEYFVSRFWSGLLRPKLPILGCEFAGVVEQIGKDVTAFNIGDKVFGFNDKTFGGHAEYLCMPQDQGIAVMPQNFDFNEAAAIAEGAHYALVDIRAAKVQAGQEVLVYGATGAIGSAAVQLLKHFGARITAVCNTQNVDLVKRLGADVVIDYQTQDFTQTNTLFHFIFDAVGKSSYRQCKPLLTEKGIYISTELGKRGVNILLALTTPLWGGKKLLFPIPTITQEDVVFLKELAENGSFKPVIDRSYPMADIVEAYRYVESGQKTGNVVLEIVQH